MYFGHPINSYNTSLESRLLLKIARLFGGWEIENPNQEHHQIGYQKWKKEHGNGMNYYYEEVLPQCSSGIFLPFRDGKWGAGVYGEAKFLAGKGMAIFQITEAGKVTLIRDINQVPFLSVEETRRRLRTDSGEPIPF